MASLPKEIAAGLQPEKNNSIRGLLLQSGWVVEKTEDGSCMVTYVVQVIHLRKSPARQNHSNSCCGSYTGIDEATRSSCSPSSFTVGSSGMAAQVFR